MSMGNILLNKPSRPVYPALEFCERRLPSAKWTVVIVSVERRPRTYGPAAVVTDDTTRRRRQSPVSVASLHGIAGRQDRIDV